MQVWQPANLTQICPAHNHFSACSYFGYLYLNFITELFGGSLDSRIQEKLGIDEDGQQLYGSEREGINPYYKGVGKGHENERDEYDFIVVGAGSAGCVVTNKLVENNFKVLLLEAGLEQPDITLVPGLTTSLLMSNIDWDFKTSSNGKSCLATGGICTWPGGKMMGGGSSINAMTYVRGSRADYDGWAAMGNEGWSYKDVLPYFKEAERNLNINNVDRPYHGFHGLQSVSHLPYIDRPSFMLTEAFQERGLPLADYNGAFQMATMQSQTFTSHGSRVSTNNAYIQPIRYTRKNLTVKIKSEVTKILINNNKVAYGVVYERKGKNYTAFAKNEVIVSSGTVNSPKLLMLSGIGPKEHLKSLNIPVLSNLAVGFNLQDHVVFNGYAISLPLENSTIVSEETCINDILAWKNGKIGPMSGEGPVNSVAFIRTEPNQPAVDIQYQFVNLLLNEWLSDPAGYLGISTLPTTYYNAMIPRVMNVVPKSRGRIYLNSTHPLADPIIYPNYLGNELDFIPLIKGVQFVLSLENTKAFKDMGARFSRDLVKGCEHLKWGTDSYTICLARLYTSSQYHLAGSNKMGPSWDQTAVVDPSLKVYGIKNLRVIDASIMPVVVRGNTNAATIMIGEKGAAFLIEDWGVKKSIN